MEQQIDFVGDDEDDQRSPLARLADQALEEEAEVIRLTQELRVAYNQWQRTVEQLIPRAMEDAGMKDYTLLSGDKVTVRETYVGGKLTDQEGLEWVANHDGEDCIKHEITIGLPKDSADVAKRLLETIRRDPAANSFTKLTVDRHVHQSTIGAFVKTRIEAGDKPPLEKLGVVRKVIARIAGKKRARTTPVELKGIDYK